MSDPAQNNETGGEGALSTDSKERRATTLHQMKRAYPRAHEQYWKQAERRACRSLELEGFGPNITDDFFQYRLDQWAWEIAWEKMRPKNTPFPFTYLGPKRGDCYSRPSRQYSAYLESQRKKEIDDVVFNAMRNVRDDIVKGVSNLSPLTSAQCEALSEQVDKHEREKERLIVERKKWEADRADLQQRLTVAEAAAADYPDLQERLKTAEAAAAGHRDLEQRLKDSEKENARLSQMLDEWSELTKNAERLSNKRRRIDTKEED